MQVHRQRGDIMVQLPSSGGRIQQLIFSDRWPQSVILRWYDHEEKKEYRERFQDDGAIIILAQRFGIAALSILDEISELSGIPDALEKSGKEKG
jgi:hypothetical protein